MCSLSNIFDSDNQPIFSFKTEFTYFNIQFAQSENLIMIYELYSAELFEIIPSEVRESSLITKNKNFLIINQKIRRVL